MPEGKEKSRYRFGGGKYALTFSPKKKNRRRERPTAEEMGVNNGVQQEDRDETEAETAFNSIAAKNSDSNPSRSPCMPLSRGSEADSGIGVDDEESSRSSSSTTSTDSSSQHNDTNSTMMSVVRDDYSYSTYSGGRSFEEENLLSPSHIVNLMFNGGDSFESYTTDENPDDASSNNWWFYQKDAASATSNDTRILPDRPHEEVPSPSRDGEAHSHNVTRPNAELEQKESSDVGNKGRSDGSVGSSGRSVSVAKKVSHTQEPSARQKSSSEGSSQKDEQILPSVGETWETKGSGLIDGADDSTSLLAKSSSGKITTGLFSSSNGFGNSQSEEASVLIDDCDNHSSQEKMSLSAISELKPDPAAEITQSEKDILSLGDRFSWSSVFGNASNKHISELVDDCDDSESQEKMTPSAIRELESDSPSKSATSENHSPPASDFFSWSNVFGNASMKHHTSDLIEDSEDSVSQEKLTPSAIRALKADSLSATTLSMKHSPPSDGRLSWLSVFGNSRSKHTSDPIDDCEENASQEILTPSAIRVLRKDPLSETGLFEKKSDPSDVPFSWSNFFGNARSKEASDQRNDCVDNKLPEKPIAPSVRVPRKVSPSEEIRSSTKESPSDHMISEKVPRSNRNDGSLISSMNSFTETKASQTDERNTKEESQEIGEKYNPWSFCAEVFGPTGPSGVESSSDLARREINSDCESRENKGNGSQDRDCTSLFGVPFSSWGVYSNTSSCEHCRQPFSFIEGKVEDYVGNPRAGYKASFHDSCRKSRAEMEIQRTVLLRQIDFFGYLKRENAGKTKEKNTPKHLGAAKRKKIKVPRGLTRQGSFWNRMRKGNWKKSAPVEKEETWNSLARDAMIKPSMTKDNNISRPRATRSRSPAKRGDRPRSRQKQRLPARAGKQRTVSQGTNIPQPRSSKKTRSKSPRHLRSTRPASPIKTNRSRTLSPPRIQTRRSRTLSPPHIKANRTRNLSPSPTRKSGKSQRLQPVAALKKAMSSGSKNHSNGEGTKSRQRIGTCHPREYQQESTPIRQKNRGSSPGKRVVPEPSTRRHSEQIKSRASSPSPERRVEQSTRRVQERNIRMVKTTPSNIPAAEKTTSHHILELARRPNKYDDTTIPCPRSPRLTSFDHHVYHDEISAPDEDYNHATGNNRVKVSSSSRRLLRRPSPDRGVAKQRSLLKRSSKQDSGAAAAARAPQTKGDSRGPTSNKAKYGDVGEKNKAKGMMRLFRQGTR